MNKINIKEWLEKLSQSPEKHENNPKIFSYRSDNWESKPIVDPEKVNEFLKIYTIDDSISPDFFIERSSTHDGTLIFITELFTNILDSILPEIERYLLSKNANGAAEQLDIIVKRIIITNITRETIYLNPVSEEKHWPGQKDIMRIGIKIDL